MYITKKQFNSLKNGDILVVNGRERKVLQNKQGYLTISRVKSSQATYYDSDVRKNMFFRTGAGVVYTYSDLYKNINACWRVCGVVKFMCNFTGFIKMAKN